MKEIREIRTDFIDDDNYQHIDAWYSDDENAEGETIALVCLDTQKVIYMDNIHRLNVRVKEAIAEILNEKEFTVVCDDCGGENVQVKAWVKPNERNAYVDSAGEDTADNWCEDCEDHVGFSVK